MGIAFELKAILNKDLRKIISPLDDLILIRVVFALPGDNHGHSIVGVFTWHLSPLFCGKGPCSEGHV